MRAYVNCWVTRKLGVVDLAAQSLTERARVGARADRRDAELSVAARQALLLHRPRAAGRTPAQRREGRRRLVVVWLVPSRRPHRQHDVGVRGGSAPDDVAGRLVLARPGRAEAAHLQLDRHLRRASRLRAQHARRLRWPRRDHDRGRRSPTATSSTRRRRSRSRPTARDRRPAASRSRSSPTTRPRAVRSQGLGRHRQLREDDRAGQGAQAHGDAAAVARGRQLFVDGGCAKCHGGAGWTVSRRFFTPSRRDEQHRSAPTAFTIPAFFPATWMYNADASTPTKRN